VARVLVIEDSPEYQLTIKACLQEDHELVFLSSAENVFEEVVKSNPELILLDIGLPHMDGWKVCEVLRSHQNTRLIPIIFVTGRKTTEDVVKGFGLGAEDYVIKPFRPEELRARCGSRLRLKKEGREKNSKLAYGLFRLDLMTNELSWKDERWNLTPIECHLMALFLSHPGKTWTRADLKEKIFKGKISTASRSVDMHVSYLRKKSKELARRIESIYKVGYVFRVEGDLDSSA
jgi:two-component system alkaline phosphatase synthesis response regulator PhoP